MGRARGTTARGEREAGVPRRWRAVIGGVGSLLLLSSAGTAAVADDDAEADPDAAGPEPGDRAEGEITTGQYEACEGFFGTGKVVVAFDDEGFEPDDVEDLQVVAEDEEGEACRASEPWMFEPPYDLAGYQALFEQAETDYEDADPGFEVVFPDEEALPRHGGDYIITGGFNLRDTEEEWSYRVEVTWDRGEAEELELSEPLGHEACDIYQGGDRDAEAACRFAAMMSPVVFSDAEEPTPVEACPPGEVPAAGFGDVAAGNVHAAAIDCIAWYRITLGVTADTYEPSVSVPRAQKASFVARLMERAGVELPAVDEDAFDDIAGSTHAEAISQLAALGVVEGRADGSFEPRSHVTRGQSASMIVRALDEILEMDLPAPAGPFTDTAGNTHEQAIDAAAEAGIVRGVTPTTFAPGSDTRRDQMASMLARTLAVLADEGYVTPPVETPPGER